MVTKTSSSSVVTPNAYTPFLSFQSTKLLKVKSISKSSLKIYHLPLVDKTEIWMFDNIPLFKILG